MVCEDERDIQFSGCVRNCQLKDSRFGGRCDWGT